MKIIKKELNVHGSWTCAFTFPEAITLVTENKINLKDLITHRYSAENGIKAFEEAFQYSENRIKTIINFN
jgi:threonine dehydrogenase-like Zn-dependent dehydrogenase